MQTTPVSLPAARAVSRAPGGAWTVVASEPRVCLEVASIGHRVWRADYSCKVHSVFARACNFEYRDTLLTLVAPRAGDGPTTLVLRSEAPRDLRRLFSAGEVVRCRDGIASARRAALLLGDASVWWPRVRRPALAQEHIEANLQLAAERLARCRIARSSCIAGPDGLAIADSLARACSRLDRDAAVRAIDRLIGWGEGLTPAGDDFLVGHLAAWARLARRNNDRGHFLDEIGASVLAAAPRTTPIAAHLLRLAVQGHFSASIDDLLDALLCESGHERVSTAIDRALDQGATSGADTVSGLLSALWAWSPVAVDA
jgi:uncharacterized protein DUF2877